MYEDIYFRIKGLPPGTMMHNGQLASPLNEWAKGIKAITSKNSAHKTDADELEKSRLEWYGSLYLDNQSRIVWPANNIEAMFVTTSSQKRKKKAFQAGFLVPEDALLLYEGPRDLAELWECGRFTDVRGARPRGGGTVQRTRPVFPEWAIEFTVSFLPSLLNRQTIIDVLTLASYVTGLSDYRPKFGRFTVEDVA